MTFADQFKMISASRLSNTSILFLLMAPIVVIFYAFFIFNPNHIDHPVLYVVQILADVISMVVLLGLWVTILLDVLVPTHHHSFKPNKKNFLEGQTHTVDVLIPTAGESVEIVRHTVKCSNAMTYPHETFILDDAKSLEIKKMAEELGAHYITRSNNLFAKSGNVNHGLKYSKGEFFVIFDADQAPKPKFIEYLLPYMEDEKLSFVQSPQFYSNTDEFIGCGAAQSQDVFYKYVCPAKNISNSAFCVGTNMIFRRKAIDDIGGIAQRNHSEDIWTSYLLHSKGWKSLFVNKVLVIGLAPSSIPSFFKQQKRWSKGGLDMLFTDNPLFNKNLTLDQRIQYFFSNMFFLVGIPILVYTLSPILYLLFEVKALRSDQPSTWLLYYLPYVTLYYSLNWLLLGKLHISTVATSLASFYPYLQGLSESLFGAKTSWVATTAVSGGKDIIMRWIWPHVFLIILSLFAIFVGWYNPSNPTTTAFQTVWVIFNMYLLIIFITGEKRIVKG